MQQPQQDEMAVAAPSPLFPLTTRCHVKETLSRDKIKIHDNGSNVALPITFCPPRHAERSVTLFQIAMAGFFGFNFVVFHPKPNGVSQSDWFDKHHRCNLWNRKRRQDLDKILYGAVKLVIGQLVLIFREAMGTAVQHAAPVAGDGAPLLAHQSAADRPELQDCYFLYLDESGSLSFYVEERFVPFFVQLDAWLPASRHQGVVVALASTLLQERMAYRLFVAARLSHQVRLGVESRINTAVGSSGTSSLRPSTSKTPPPVQQDLQVPAEQRIEQELTASLLELQRAVDAIQQQQQQQQQQRSDVGQYTSVAHSVPTPPAFHQHHQQHLYHQHHSFHAGIISNPPQTPGNHPGGPVVVTPVVLPASFHAQTPHFVMQSTAQQQQQFSQAPPLPVGVPQASQQGTSDVLSGTSVPGEGLE